MDSRQEWFTNTDDRFLDDPLDAAPLVREPLAVPRRLLR
jgi:hypothetical protein